RQRVEVGRTERTHAIAGEPGLSIEVEVGDGYIVRVSGACNLHEAGSRGRRGERGCGIAAPVDGADNVDRLIDRKAFEVSSCFDVHRIASVSRIDATLNAGVVVRTSSWGG